MRVCTAVVLTVLVSVPAAAQTHPDFSGTWTIDAAKSDPAPAAPAGRGRGTNAPPPNQLAIRQTPTDIVFTRGAQTLTFQFDGTETFWFQQGEIRATMAWEGDRVAISWRKEVFTPAIGDYVKTSGKDVYGLSGGALTQESTTVSTSGTTRVKTVFTKVS